VEFEKELFDEVSALAIRILEMSDQARNRPVSNSSDAADAIQKLANLKENGIITTLEFEQKKSELLKRM